MSKDTFENRKIPENKERLAKHRCFLSLEDLAPGDE
jgi:hypothetical protein